MCWNFGGPVKHLTTPLFTPSVASSFVGVSVHTLRRWEAHGLVAPVRVGRSRRRLYSWSDIERLQQIRYLVARKRVPLRQVKPLLRVSLAKPAPTPFSKEGRKGEPLGLRLAISLPR